MSAPVTTAGLDGLYTTDLTLGPDPAQNIVEARGSAPVSLPTVNPVSGLFSSPTTTLQAGTVFKIWGVKPTVEPNQLIMINSDEYPVKDTEILFTVLPADYQYSTRSLFLDFYEKDTLNNESWIGFVQADHTGKIILTRGGVKFNPEYTYSVQLIVDRGRKIEVMSEKVTIPVAQIRVVTDEITPKETDEIKFSDGSNKSNGTKKYHIELKTQSGHLFCETLTGRIVTLSTATATMGQPVGTPQNTGDAYAAEYALAFKHPLLPLENNLCNVQIIDTLDNGSRKDKFILSNRPRTSLDVGLPYSNIKNTAVLYGGIGNKFMVEVAGVQKEILIEPVGIVILGIDGLRQDVLYPDTMDGQPFENVNEPAADYYVDASTLSGFGQILVGDPHVSAKQKYIMLPKVTTIFPSITFAAWASIFTGKTPKETGILGNEFFGRDIYGGYATPPIVPGMTAAGIPYGMVTLDADGGSFRPLIDGYAYSLVNLSSIEKTKSLPFILKHIMPAEFDSYNYDTLSKKNNQSAPNAALIKSVMPLWDEINTTVARKFDVNPNADIKCSDSQYECRTVSMFNQYFRNVDWYGTPAAVSLPIYNAWITQGGDFGAATMDSFAAEESVDFIEKYFSANKTNGKRKRFPAVFSVYLSGLDHYAHVDGLGGYVNYFKTVTDEKIWKIAKALKDQDEFDNKIFIIVSDHGETQMPTDLKYKDTNWLGFQVDKEAEMSCALKIEFGDTDNPDMSAQNAEQENNNLHVWELGEIFKAIGQSGGIEYRVLAPAPISNLYSALTVTGMQIALSYGATKNIGNANVIATLNGPMAHIYLKGPGGWSDENPNIKEVTILAKYLKGYLKDGGVLITDKDVKKSLTKLLSSVDRILIRVNGVYKDFVGVQLDVNDNVIGPNAAIINETYFDTNTYVSAFNRIDKMNHSKRSGDLVLIMKDSTTGADSDRYSTAYACKSWHGSLNRSDSYVPFIVAYPGGNKTEMQLFVDTTPGCNSTMGCDGNWKVTDLIKTIVQKQFGTQ